MNECGCGCGCKIKLKVDDESPIGLQIIDGETVRVDCADFLIRTDKDYNHLENKPSINDVTLEGDKTLEELGIDLDAKLDKPPMTGQSNGFLKNNLNGGDPDWTIGMYAHEVVPNNGGAGYIELNLGNGTDYKTAPYGRYGVLRLIFTDGDKRGIVSLVTAPPLVSGEKKAYYFIESNQAQTSNYMLSSPNRDNTTGRLAKFDGGTSITESELTEEDINNKIDKPSLTGQNSGLLRNNIDGEPSWTIGAYVDEQVSDGVRAGFTQLTLGNAEDYRTPPYGRYGTLRLIMTDGDKRGIAIFGMASPLVSGEKKAYYFLESNHAQTNNYMLSSANRDNTANKLAVFADGTSLSSGTLGENDIELKANKVTTLSSSSTDTEYPSAKAVYDAIQGGGSAETRHLTLALENGTYYLEDENGVRLTPEAFEDISIGDTDISTPSLVSKNYYQVVYSNVKLQLMSKTYTLILANISDASNPARARLITLTSQGDDVVYTGTTAEDYPLLDDTDYAKLSGIEAGAEVNTIDTVKVNGTALTPDASKAVDISVPAAQVSSDWDALSGVAQILNKPTIPDVAPLSSAEIDLICV